MKKRQEEKLLQHEQRKAEKNALREKKIVCHSFIPSYPHFISFFQQEKYMEIVLTKEMKRIAEDMQIRDTKVKIIHLSYLCKNSSI